MNRCPRCQDELPASASFCGKCGVPLSNKAGLAEEVLSLRLSGQSSTRMIPDNLLFRRSMVGSMFENMKRAWEKEKGFWLIISLMLCVIVGLGVFIALSYLSNPASGMTSVLSAGRSVQPTLNVRAPLSATVTQGQTLLLHGEQFRPDDAIAFLLDFALPIKDKNNQTISIRASSDGSFNIAIPVLGSDWSASTHSIAGVDKRTKQDAYLTVVVSPAVVAETTSRNLALSMQKQPVTSLTFRAVVGQGNPAQQRVTLTNTSGVPLSWTATVSTDGDLDWLLIDDNHVAGRLDIDGTDSIGISVLITALTSNSPPYTGAVVFTINGQEQLTLPIELQVTDAQSEVVFTPNPAVATIGPGGTCHATPFTLINVGSSFANWTLVPFDQTKDHLQFIADGRSITQGELTSAGTPGDTQVLNLQCNGVVVGKSYQFSMYIDNTSWPLTITIQG